MSADMINNGYFKCPTLRFTPWQELNDIMDLSPSWDFTEMTPEIQQAAMQAIEGHTLDKEDHIGREKLRKALKDKILFLDSWLDDLFVHIHALSSEQLDEKGKEWNIKPSYPNLIFKHISNGSARIAKARHEVMLQGLASLGTWGVLSLSATNDDLLCWSYYTRHTGFSIKTTLVGLLQ